MAITAKVVRAAASSVAGARSMGIETAASRAAPELLARAEAALRAISGRADDAAMSQSGGRLAAQADALESAVRELREAISRESGRLAAQAISRESAVRELREALGVAEDVPAIAEIQPPAEPQPEETGAPEETGVPVGFEAAWEAACRMYGECYDQHGRRVAMFVFRREYDGRMSSLGGWNPGGPAPETVMFVTEDGRGLCENERVSVRGSSVERELRSGRLDMAGVMGVDQTSATSEWLPVGAAAAPIVVFGVQGASPNPAYQGDWDASAAWEEAFADRRARRAAAKEAAKAPADPVREWTLADLAVLSRKRKRA